MDSYLKYFAPDYEQLAAVKQKFEEAKAWEDERWQEFRDAYPQPEEIIKGYINEMPVMSVTDEGRLWFEQGYRYVQACKRERSIRIVENTETSAFRTLWQRIKRKVARWGMR